MIVYGINGRHFANRDLPHIACPACHTAGSLQVGLVSQYAHVYAIPFFPYQKRTVVGCQHCGATWPHGALAPELQPAVREVKKATRHPWWTWSGTTLLALGLVAAYLFGIRNHHTDDALLTQPRAGDIYTIHNDSTNRYSLLRVQRVGGNSVELVANEFETADSDPINSLNRDSRYSKEPFVLTRLDLQVMRRNGTLTDVDRFGE